MKPRIAVVTPYFPIREEPYRGHSAYQTLRRMTDWADIQVFCPLVTYPKWQWLRPRSFRYRRADLTYSPPDLRTTYLEYQVFPVLSRPFNGQACKRRLMPLLERWKPDLILNYWLYPDGYAAVAAGRTLGVPAIVCAIGSDVCRIQDPATRWLTRKTLRQASFVITVSEELRRQVIRWGAAPERVRTVLNGCDTRVFHPADRLEARAQLGLDPEAQLVLFVGSLIPSKGLWELVDALLQLLPSHPRLQVVGVGEGSLRGPLEARLARAGAAGRLRLAGRCSSEQVARWMAAADVFCLPSYSEGCPNVVIEAIACGRPVVATKVGGIPELVESACGLLVPPRDSRSLSCALAEALAWRWDAQSIAERFSRPWERVAEETIQICCEVLGAPR